MCSRLEDTSFVRSQPKSARTLGTHTRHAQRKVCVKNNLHRVPSRGVDPSVKFLDDANATHSSSFEHTPTPVLCGPYAPSSFAKLRVIEYLLPTKLNYSSSACVSLQIPIAFGPNPTYRFSSLCATRGVCRFLLKQARRARFEFIQHIRDLATKMHVTCPQTYLYTTVSCPYEGRAMDPSLIYKAQIVCVCVCVCVCVRVWRPCLLSVRNRNRHAHSARTGKGLRNN